MLPLLYGPLPPPPKRKIAAACLLTGHCLEFSLRKNILNYLILNVHCRILLADELQNEMIMLPTFLKVRVRIIEGMTGYSTAQWVDVLEGWKKVVKHPSLNAIKPPIGTILPSLRFIKLSIHLYSNSKW